MAQDQFHFNVTTKTMQKILESVVTDHIANKKLMIDYLTRIIMKGNNGENFFMALTDTFPEIIFKPGDKVRIMRKTLWYSIDDEKSREQGYIEGDGIYAVIKEINSTDINCYIGVISFIDTHGQESNREIEFNHNTIMMDNTIKLSMPTVLPGNII